MGLAVSVGFFGDLDSDDEFLEEKKAELKAINQLLSRNGLPAHDEKPETVIDAPNSIVASFPYSWLQYLRQAYAHRTVDPNWLIPAAASTKPLQDSVLREQTDKRSSHLLYHSDAEGYYLPIDFVEVLVDNSGAVAGAGVGSSIRLREELLFVAPAIGLELVGEDLSERELPRLELEAERNTYGAAVRVVWHTLFEAAKSSIRQNAAIVFC